MQLSLIFALASAALAHGSAPCGGEPAPCHAKEHHSKPHGFKKPEFKKPCLLCPGACLCAAGKAHNQDKYPHGVCPEHGEKVFVEVSTKTGCETQHEVHTSQETRTEVINHCQTSTHVFHPEQTFTLTRTESYVVWPAQTSFAKDKCCDKHGNCNCGPPCSKHGRHGCC